MLTMLALLFEVKWLIQINVYNASMFLGIVNGDLKYLAF